MKVAVLGANWSLCSAAIDQMVVPANGLPSPSVQVKAAPPHSWTSIPRCCLYQACSAGASLALKKMPPIPVTRFIDPPRFGGAERDVRPPIPSAHDSMEVKENPRLRVLYSQEGRRKNR